MRLRRLHVVLVLAVGCTIPPAISCLPSSVRSVAVFPPNNQTGDVLLIAGGSVLEQYVLHTDRITVPDVLASEARIQFARRGFTVVAAEVVDAATAARGAASVAEAATVAARHQIEGAVLYVEIRRWEADAPFQPTFVIASASATLVEASTARVLWRADHPSRPVPTPGVVNLGEAYAIAARTVMDALLAGLGPRQPAS